MIDSSNCPNLSNKQIKSINIKEIGEDHSKKLVQMIYDTKRFDCLTSIQINDLKLKLFNKNIQKQLIHQCAKQFNIDLIQSIDFLIFEDLKIILLDLNNAKKLEYLTEEQIKQINIYYIDNEQLIKSMFMTSSFAKYFTNGAIEKIDDELFKMIDFGNVEVGFLNKVVMLMLKKLDSDQIKQILIDNLYPNVKEYFLKTELKRISINQLQNIDLNNMINLLNKIILCRCEDLSSIQVKTIPIKKLKIEAQIKLLKLKSKDLLDDQIQFFDVTNTEISDILLTDFFFKMVQEQINSVDISKTSLKNQVKILNKDCIFFENLSENIIQNVDLIQLKSFNYTIYYELILLKSKLFTVHQFMVIDWLDNSNGNNPPIDFLTPAKFFISHFKKCNISCEYLLEDIKITKELLSIIPKEILVAILNSRIIHNSIDEYYCIDDFIPIIEIMFQNNLNFICSVNFILINWTTKLHSIISKKIHLLKPAAFSNEAVIILLKHYIMELNIKTLQNLDLFDVPGSIIENSLIERAIDFDIHQFENINYYNHLGIREDLQYLQMNDISSVSLINLNEALINFLVNKKLNLLTKSQIRQIKIMELNSNMEDKLIKEKVTMLDEIQVKYIRICRLSNDSLALVIINRFKDMSRDQIRNINIKKLSGVSLSFYIKEQIPLLGDIKKELCIETINQIDNDVFIQFLEIYMKKLSLKQIQGINNLKLSNSKIAAYLLKNNCRSLTKDQIGYILDNNNVFILNSELVDAKCDKLLRESHHFKYIPKDKLNSVIDFSNVENIYELLHDDLENEINDENVKLMNIEKVFTNIQLQYVEKLIKSCGNKFSNQQFHKLDTKNIFIIKTVLQNYLQNRLSSNQIHLIELEKLDENELFTLINDRSTDLTKDQIKLKCITNIMNMIDEKDLIKFIREHILDFSEQQIHSFQYNSNEINAILFIYRAADVSVDLIQSSNLFLNSPIDQEIQKEKCIKNVLTLISDAKRLKDLSENQFNKVINYKNKSILVEILEQNLQNRITKENAQVINLKDVIQECNNNQNLIVNLFESCHQNFTKNQLNSLDFKDKFTNQLIIQFKLFKQLSDNNQSKIDLNIIFNSNDQNLVAMINDPIKNDFDNAIIGLLIYRYMTEPNQYLEAYLTPLFSQRKYYDVFYAKFVLIAETKFGSNGLRFSRIARNLFQKFEERSVINGLRQKKIITWKSSEFVITPDDFQKIIWQKLKCIDLEEARKIINSSKKLFSSLENEYKFKMWEFKVMKINDDGIEKEEIVVDTNQSQLKKLFNWLYW